eukprot:g17012.t1
MLYESLIAGTFLATAVPDALVIIFFSGIGFSRNLFALVARDDLHLLSGRSALISIAAFLLYFIFDIGKASKKTDFCDLQAWIGLLKPSNAADQGKDARAEEEMVKLRLRNYKLFSRFLSQVTPIVGLGLSFQALKNPGLHSISWASQVRRFVNQALENPHLAPKALKKLSLQLPGHGGRVIAGEASLKCFPGARRVWLHVIGLQPEKPRRVLLDGIQETFVARANEPVSIQLFSMVPTKDFFTAAAMSFSICGTIMLAVWIGWRMNIHFDLFNWEFDDFQLNYTGHCLMTNSSLYEEHVREVIGGACDTLNNVLQMQQWCPAVVGVIHVMSALCCTFMLQADPSMKRRVSTSEGVLSDGELAAATKLQAILTPGNAGRLGQAQGTVLEAFYGFGLGGTLTIFGYVYVMQVIRNGWLRAFMVCVLNFLIPLILLVDRLRQSVRRCRGVLDVTEDAEVNICSFITILLFVGLKSTYVFFSWLNYYLLAAQLDYVAICSLVFAIGALAGRRGLRTAVYLFSGVVLGFYSTAQGHHLFVGIAIGSVLSSILKHVACVGRRHENKRGFALGKVCILVAGPDFPTSVLCGILRLNIPQMLLGTTPIIVVSIIPQVTVGALLTVPGNGKEYSAVATVLAAALQVLATLYVSYRALSGVREELSQYREEHEQVAELTKREASYTRKFLEVSSWAKLPVHMRALTVGTSAIFWCAAICFQPFSMTDRIEDDAASGGLDGNVWNIVQQPLGTVVLVSSLVACLLHILIGVWLDRATRQRLCEVNVEDRLDPVAPQISLTPPPPPRPIVSFPVDELG